MKKIISVILALVMLMSCVTFASAKADRDEVQQLRTAYYTFLKYLVSFYNIEGQGVYAFSNFTELHEFYDGFLSSEWYIEASKYESLNEWTEGISDDIPKRVEQIYRDVAKVEAFLEENNYILVLDGYNIGVLEYNIDFVCSDHKDFHAFVEEYIDLEKLEEIEDKAMDAHKIVYNKALSDITSVSQKELDDALGELTDFILKTCDCYEGYHLHGEYTDLGNGTHKTDCTFCKTTDITEAHTYGEYISDNNATTEADGTKTAKCTKCTATDTVADKGTKLPPEENNDSDSEDFFTSIINAIKNFFKQIADFFKNLFG